MPAVRPCRSEFRSETRTMRETLIKALSYAVLISTAVTSAQASDILVFRWEAFKRATATGGPTLIETYSPGCMTCWIQEPTIRGIVQKPEFSSFQVFVIDADNQEEAMHLVGAQTRSTLIVYRNGAEVGRSVGVTRPADIEMLLRKGL